MGLGEQRMRKRKEDKDKRNIRNRRIGGKEDKKL